MLTANKAGRVDNRPWRAVPTCWSSPAAPMEAPLDLVGEVSRHDLHRTASRSIFDVFVRLCDVDPRGRSWNICDGLVRVVPGRFPRDADGVTGVPVPM